MPLRVQAEAERLAAVQRELKGLKVQQVKKGQVLYDLRHKEKEMISEISGTQSQIKNLGDSIKRLDEKVRVYRSDCA